MYLKKQNKRDIHQLASNIFDLRTIFKRLLILSEGVQF